MTQSSPRTRGCSVHMCTCTVVVGVLPAHAGLFRSVAGCPIVIPCPPRARGAVPTAVGADRRVARSSPRTRGCSQQAGVGVPQGVVLPAHAGLFPTRVVRDLHRQRPPRARGAVPLRTCAATTAGPSSPRTRGCSSSGRRLGFQRSSFPRTRGCSPGDTQQPGRGLVLPAHAGLFREVLRLVDLEHVLPTHAGLFPAWRRKWGRGGCHPRARGAVPLTRSFSRTPATSSPCTRGCFLGPQRERARPHVVPVCAGLFPSSSGADICGFRGPRARRAGPDGSRASSGVGGAIAGGARQPQPVKGGAGGAAEG